MMEGIRASLATEEERHRQQDKAAKKENKKAEKEAKKMEKAAEKAEKAARKAEKAGLYSNSANASKSGLSTRSETSLDAGESSSAAAGKGKATLKPTIESPSNAGPSLPSGRMPPRSETDVGLGTHPFVWDSQANAQSHLERARAQLNPELSPSLPFGSSSYRPSHLRTTSNVSSSASSINESLPGLGRNAFQGSSSSLEPSPSASGENLGQASSSSEAFISGTPPGGGAGTEPMFNFRSLAAMIDKDEKVASTSEDAAPTGSNGEDLPHPNHTTNDGATKDGRSDSVATERPRTEFYDSTEYPHNGLGANTNEYNPTIEMKDDCNTVENGDSKMHKGKEHGFT